MKHIKKTFLMIITAVFLLTFMSSCSSFAFDTEYQEYYFSQQYGSFEKSGKGFVFYKNQSFDMLFNGDRVAFGTYTNYKMENYLKVVFNTTIKDSDINAFKKQLEETEQNYFTQEEIADLMRSIVLYEDLHYYKDYMFSNSSIEAYRFINDATANYTGVEGVYVVNNLSVLMKLEAGNIYLQDTSNPVEDEFPLQRGYYTIEKDFIVMTFLYATETSSEQYTMKYLLADFTLPSDLTVDLEEEELDWEDEIDIALSALGGKKIACLVKSFYSSVKL